MKGMAMRRILVATVLAAIGLAPVPATAGSAHHCFGEVPTVVGTRGFDQLSGDVVVGLGGRDIIHARLACGNSGDDYSVSGAEKADGGPGGDEYVSTRGSLAEGGPDGDNLFSQSESSQVLRGEEGNDEWVSREDSGETDFFYGGPGDDKTGIPDGYFEQDTRQYGGEGNDSLAGGGGRDKLYGGPGNDTLDSVRYVFAPGDDGIQDLLWGGDGFDTCIMGPTDKAVNCEVVEVVE